MLWLSNIPSNAVTFSSEPQGKPCLQLVLLHKQLSGYLADTCFSYWCIKINCSLVLSLPSCASLPLPHIFYSFAERTAFPFYISAVLHKTEFPESLLTHRTRRKTLKNKHKCLKKPRQNAKRKKTPPCPFSKPEWLSQTISFLEDSDNFCNSAKHKAAAFFLIVSLGCTGTCTCTEWDMIT